MDVLDGVYKHMYKVYILQLFNSCYMKWLLS